MNTNYFKCSLMLLLFLPAIALTLIAQQKGIGVDEQLKGMTLSEKEGILSKINAGSKELNQKATDPFYVHALPHKRHGMINNSTLNNKSSYDYNEHNYLGVNIPMSAVTDDLGNTYITGATSNEHSPEGNYVAIKLDATGNQVWETILPGTQYAYEMGIAAGLDLNGDFITTGIHWNGFDMDIKTVKFNGATGAVLWQTINNHSGDALDIPTALHIDPSGNVAVAGITYANNAINFLTLFYDGSGNLLWSAMDTSSPTNTWNEPTALTTDTSGNVYVTGYGAVQGGGQGGYWAAYKTLKYDSTGNQLWHETYLFERLLDETDPTSGMINTDSMPQSIAMDTAGNCYITGTFDLFGNTRIGTIKYDATGNDEWVETYRGGSTNTNITNGHDIIYVDNNTIYVGGRHRSGWADEGIILISYDNNGNENWAEETLSSIQISRSKLILDNNDLPVIAGLGYDANTFDSRVRVFRFSDQGAVLNETSYFKAQSDTEGIMGFVNLGIDLTDHVYLVMDNFYTATGQVFETVKMHINSGHNNTDWEETYSNLYGSTTQMLYSTRDNNDNTYITGRYGQIVNNEYIGTFVLTKYNAQGIIDWEKEFNSQNSNEANGIVAKVNSQGEIIVFLLPDPFESTDLLKIKKYTAAGNLVWETVKTVHNASLRAFFFDNDDNIYVSGSAKELELDLTPSFFTAKFSGSGAEIWSDFATTNDPDDFIFEINAGTVNSQGDILLTGTSGTSTMFSVEVDLTVLKYNSAGTLDWMNKYPQTNYVSSGFDIITDHLDNLYISGVRQQITNQTEQLLVLKIDDIGNEVWNTDYSQTDRLLRPYKIMKDSNGDLITTSSSTYWVIGQTPNNRINTVKLNQNDGTIEWAEDTDIDRFYADSYIDADDDVYILNQVQSSALPHRPGIRIEGGLFKISSNGTSTEELFTAPELALFFPASITPLNNGTLLLAGDISHDITFFSGFYFFESSHNPLSIQDHHQSGDKKGNWLGQNYPNPVINTTEIPFYITETGQVKFNLYDNQGRFLFEIEKRDFAQGLNTVRLDTTGLAPGLYFYQIEAGNYKFARKLIVKK